MTATDRRGPEVRAAIETVARQIARDRLTSDADLGFIDWGDYPEIGEYDWEAVIEEVCGIVPEVNRDAYQEAYDLLAARADKEDA